MQLGLAVWRAPSAGSPLPAPLARVRPATTGENARIPAYTVNEDAVRHAKRLIGARQYVLRSRWQDVQPRAREQNAFLKTHSWDEYAAWHLGLTDGAPEEAKARYAFVYGDFRRLHRMGWQAISTTALPSGGTRRSNLQRTSSCSTSTARPPNEAAPATSACPCARCGGIVAQPHEAGPTRERRLDLSERSHARREQLIEEPIDS
jgi:hypothetical protein